MELNHNELQNVPSQKQALIVIILTMLLLFISGSIAHILGIAKTELLLIEVFTIVPALIFVLHKKFSLVKTFRLRSVNTDIIVISVVIGLSLTILADEMDRLMAIIFPMPDVLTEAIKKSIVITNGYDFIIIVFSAVFLAAICEELLFRGFLQVSLEKTFDITKAIMLTALVFAIIHFNPWWSIQLIVFAVFLGVLAWKSNSIIPSIIVHGINNGIALIFGNFDESHFQWYFWRGHVQPLIILVSVILLYFGFKQFYRYCEEYNEEGSIRSNDQNWHHPID